MPRHVIVTWDNLKIALGQGVLHHLTILLGPGLWKKHGLPMLATTGDWRSLETGVNASVASAAGSGLQLK